MVGYRWRPSRGTLVSFGPSLHARGLWDHRGHLQEWEFEAPFTFQFKGPASVTVGRLEEFETFQNLGFRENASYVYFSSQRLRWMGVDASFVHGTNINFEPAAGTAPFLRNSDDASLALGFRPTSRLELQETYLYSRLGTRVTASPSVFNNHLLRAKMSYQLTKSLSLRAIVDYGAVLPNPALTALESSKRITTDVLLTYLLRPGTAIYVGYAGDEYLRAMPLEQLSDEELVAKYRTPERWSTS
jgi:hypothetical protein